MKFSIKKLISFFAMLCILLATSACTSTNKFGSGRYANLSPNSFVFKSSDGFEFVQLHDDVIDRMHEEIKDITSLVVYIVNETLDIDGDNEAKEIHLKFEVWPVISDADIEATVTLLMKYIADAACIQQDKYEPATTESFGTVWNDYTLVIDVARQQPIDNKEGKESPSYHKVIKAGEPIPYEPRLINWGDDYLEEED